MYMHSGCLLACGHMNASSFGRTVWSTWGDHCWMGVQDTHIYLPCMSSTPNGIVAALDHCRPEAAELKA